MELVILLICIYLLIRYRKVLFNFIFGYILFVLLILVIFFICVVFNL